MKLCVDRNDEIGSKVLSRSDVSFRFLVSYPIFQLEPASDFFSFLSFALSIEGFFEVGATRSGGS